MTLIASCIFANGDVGIWGDSIVTRVNPSEPVIEGVTTRGETTQLTIEKNIFLDRVEAACKVGKFGDSTICGVTTDDAEFAYSLVDLLEPTLSTLKNLEQMRQSLVIACNSLAGEKKSSMAELMVAANLDIGRTNMKFTVSRNALGACSFNTQFHTINAGEESLFFEGSGRSLATQDGFRSIQDMYFKDPAFMRPAIPGIVSENLSMQVRKAQNNTAPGVGGAFFGYLLTDHGVFASSDLLFIHSDKNGFAQVVSKTVLHDDMFFVSDLIRGRISVFSTLSATIQARRLPEGTTKDISAGLEKLQKFEAQTILLDLRHLVENGKVDFRVYHQTGGNAIIGSHRPGVLSLTPGSKLILGKGKDEITIRIPGGKPRPPNNERRLNRKRLKAKRRKQK